MNIDPDYDLVQQCRSNDPTLYEPAFKRVYEKYGEKVFNISYRILGNREDASDVTQDAFITLFRKISNFRKDSRFFTWFYRIVVNLCIDRKRKKVSSRLINESERTGGLVDVPDQREDAIKKLTDQEFLETRVQQSLLKLSPNLRTVTVLRYIEGLSYIEIAETLNASLGTVKSRLNRAHRNLEELLDKEIHRPES